MSKAPAPFVSTRIDLSDQAPAPRRASRLPDDLEAAVELGRITLSRAYRIAATRAPLPEVSEQPAPDAVTTVNIVATLATGATLEATIGHERADLIVTGARGALPTDAESAAARGFVDEIAQHIADVSGWHECACGTPLREGQAECAECAAILCDECGDAITTAGLCEDCTAAITCRTEGCDERSDGGDGYDGYCASHADEAEQAGEFA